MAEMTAAEAIEILPRRKMLSYKLDGKSVNTILLTEDEQRRIAALIEQQAQEIAKKDRTLDRSCEKIVDLIRHPIANGNGLCPFSLGLVRDCFAECNDQFTVCWRKWLEKEAQGVE